MSLPDGNASAGELETLSEEVRSVLLKKLSEHGGHVGPNLGMVEATIALHYVFNSPIDKIVYDVSHQSYTHKILTGRKAAFMNAAEYDEVSGVIAAQNRRKANTTSSSSDIRRLPSALPPDWPKRVI